MAEAQKVVIDMICDGADLRRPEKKHDTILIAGSVIEAPEPLRFPTGGLVRVTIERAEFVSVSPSKEAGE